MSDAPTEATVLPFVPDEEWLSAKQVAAHWGMDEDSAYRWRQEGMIAQKFYKRRGRFWLFHPAVIAELECLFREFHEWSRGRKGGANVKEFFAQRGTVNLNHASQ